MAVVRQLTKYSRGSLLGDEIGVINRNPKRAHARYCHFRARIWFDQVTGNLGLSSERVMISRSNDSNCWEMLSDSW